MTAVDVACRSCGTGLRANAKFCDECGAPVAGSVDTAKYKQVTVLFADVVRSMDLAAALDMERLREIMTDLLERLAGVVRRYGGTVEYNGDGVMALFGAPIALEDHAFRACLAAIDLQAEANRLAAEVRRSDPVTLRLRVGLNSGRVIAGEIGSGSLGYHATGSPVGFAQRIESATPPGGVMLSESTASLVEHTVVLDEPEWVFVKGADEPVRARRLVGIGPRRDGSVGRAQASLVGRRREMAALDAMVDGAIGGRGGVVNVVGAPGIGKSRTAREVAALAAGRGAEVFWTFCESHARDVPFHAVSRLLRAGTRVADLDDAGGRARVREQYPDADPLDLLLLEDLLGIADPEAPLTQITPDARRRRLTSLINTASLARTDPALYIIEDAHWIDEVSESLMADFLTVIPQTMLMVLITSRPEYAGKLTQIPGAHTIPLAPLSNSDTVQLLGQLVGSDPSVVELAAIIADRAAGNPFFAEEMVRELAQRGVLTGERGNYVCRVDAADVTVPATVQAAIEARIDRLGTQAKQTLNAASVIGARFEAELLSALGIDAVFDELLGADLIDQVRFTRNAEYAFHHPLIRAAAYESQLKSDRVQLHRRLAAVIQEREPGSVEDNAALIAEHLEAAGDGSAAYSWHMRAAAWATNRDLAAARESWERARRIADALPGEEPDRLPMRIAPRTMLCATDFQARAVQDSQRRFAELRELCSAAGDTVSLAIGMSGPATELCYAGRAREAARLTSEQVSLLESIGDITPTMGLAPIAFVNWFCVGKFGEVLRWSQTIVDCAAGDPAKGAGFGVGSPLAIALAWRGTARWWLGRPGWRRDFHDAVAMARRSNTETFSGAVAWTYGHALQYGALRADDAAVCACEDALQTAHGASNDRAVGLAAYPLAVGLLNRSDAADRRRGLELMMQTRDLWLGKRIRFLIPVTDLWVARETDRRGDRDAAIVVMRRAVDELRRAGNLFYGVWGTGVLVETLLERGTESDLAEAQAAVNWLENLAADDGSVTLEITLLRLRTLLAHAHGDNDTYRNLLSRYRAMAKSLGFEGHIAWAEAMAQRQQAVENH